MTRRDGLNYLESRVTDIGPRSACGYCPYKSNREWVSLKKAGGQDGERAVETDEALREEGTFYKRNMKADIYLHRSCKPLKDCSFDGNQLDLFEMECEGGCGL